MLHNNVKYINELESLFTLKLTWWQRLYLVLICGKEANRHYAIRGERSKIIGKGITWCADGIECINKNEAGLCMKYDYACENCVIELDDNYINCEFEEINNDT